MTATAIGIAAVYCRHGGWCTRTGLANSTAALASLQKSALRTLGRVYSPAELPSSPGSGRLGGVKHLALYGPACGRPGDDRLRKSGLRPSARLKTGEFERLHRRTLSLNILRRPVLADLHERVLVIHKRVLASHVARTMERTLAFILAKRRRKNV